MYVLEHCILPLLLFNLFLLHHSTVQWTRKCYQIISDNDFIRQLFNFQRNVYGYIDDSTIIEMDNFY